MGKREVSGRSFSLHEIKKIFNTAANQRGCNTLICSSAAFVFFSLLDGGFVLRGIMGPMFHTNVSIFKIPYHSLPRPLNDAF
jgi:hypothetical protein